MDISLLHHTANEKVQEVTKKFIPPGSLDSLPLIKCKNFICGSTPDNLGKK